MNAVSDPDDLAFSVAVSAPLNDEGRNTLHERFSQIYDYVLDTASEAIYEECRSQAAKECDQPRVLAGIIESFGQREWQKWSRAINVKIDLKDAGNFLGSGQHFKNNIRTHFVYVDLVIRSIPSNKETSLDGIAAELAKTQHKYFNHENSYARRMLYEMMQTLVIKLGIKHIFDAHFEKLSSVPTIEPRTQIAKIIETQFNGPGQTPDESVSIYRDVLQRVIDHNLHEYPISFDATGQAADREFTESALMSVFVNNPNNVIHNRDKFALLLAEKFCYFQVLKSEPTHHITVERCNLILELINDFLDQGDVKLYEFVSETVAKLREEITKLTDDGDPANVIQPRRFDDLVHQAAIILGLQDNGQGPSISAA